MKLLHRHIFASVALTCLASIALFTFVLMLGNVLKDLLGPVLAGQLDFFTLMRLTALLVPFAVTYALPMGILTGVLLVLGRMSSDREITAIRAAGVSVAGVSAPIFFFALLGVAMSLAVNFYYMPVARVAFKQEFAQAVRQNPLSFVVPKTFIRDFPGLVLYVGEKKNDDTLHDFWLWEVDSLGRVKRFARAESGKLTYDEANNKLVLTLERAQAEQRDEQDPENFAKVRSAAAWERATFDLPLNRVGGFKSFGAKLKDLTYHQLLAEWRRLDRPLPGETRDLREKRQREQMRVQITIHEKASMAFSVLSFALFAIPLGIQVSRKETSANLGIALGLAMGYYFMTIIAGWFDKLPHLRPDLLMWVPNIAFQAIGIWLFRKVDRA